MFPPAGSKGKQGHDLQFGTNCLGPFLFTKGLLPILIKTASVFAPGSVRVTWAGSSGIQVLSPTNGVTMQPSSKGGLRQPKVSSSVQTNYGATKAANLFMAMELARRHGADGILSLCFNPGNLKTELQRHSGGLMLKASESLLHPAIFGAYIELYSGWSPDITMEKNGIYIVPWGRDGSALVSKDIAKAAKANGADGTNIARDFWEWCERETASYGI